LNEVLMESSGNGKEHPGPAAARMSPDLPPGWAWTTLREIADLKGGITKGQKRAPGTRLRQVPYLRVANVQRGHLDLADVRTIEATEGEIEELRLLPGDVLFNEGGDRDKLGRGWLWRGEIPECIHQNHVFRARLRSPDIHPKFLSWYGNSVGQDYFWNEGKHTTNLASINLAKLGSLPVALPPAVEQERIVAEIERLFSLLDAGVEALKRVQANLRRYRASVLQAACEGRLVPTEAELARAEGREYEPADVLLGRILKERRECWTGRFRDPVAPATNHLPKLPNGWTWATVDALLGQPMCNGISVKGSDAPPGVPSLKLNAMGERGFDYELVRFLPLDEARVKDIIVEAGDFFVARGNGSLHLVGRGTLAQFPPFPVVFPDTMIRLRLTPTAATTHWLPAIWASPADRAEGEDDGGHLESVPTRCGLRLRAVASSGGATSDRGRIGASAVHLGGDRGRRRCELQTRRTAPAGDPQTCL
jgi:type I restriction enzyme S subunit